MDRDAKEKKPMLQRLSVISSSGRRKSSKENRKQSTVSAGFGKDHRCGVPGCHPECMQGCANIKAYTAVLSLVLVLHFIYFSYSIGVIRTIEKRFGLPSYETGLVMSTSDIVQTVLVLVVGYLGRRTHKPRYLSISVLFSALGMFCAATPYFIYGPYQYDTAFVSQPESMTSSDNGNGTGSIMGSASGPRDIVYQICQSDAQNSSMPDRCSDGENEVATSGQVALYFMFASSILLGFGTSGLFTLGISFIDENVKKEDSALYIGAVTSMFAWGPIIGFSLAAFCTGLPEDLGVAKVSSYDPSFVGCWWLGHVVVGSLLAVVAVPMFLFPKHFRAYYEYCKTTRKPIAGNKKASVSGELKAFPKAVWLLVSNPAYMILAFSKVFAMYYVMGIMINQTRYIEIHFGQPAFVANIASGVCGALTGAAGNIAGGVVMKKLKMEEKGSALMYTIALSTVVVSLFIMMMMPCAHAPTAYDDQQAGTPFGYQVDMPCNANCGCSRDRYQPVCDADGAAYFSPCHAGCLLQTNSTQFSGCSCLEENPVLSSEWCGHECKLFIPYIVTYALVSFIGSMSHVPVTILTFRLVEPELKAFALGLISSLHNLLVFVPAPIMFGALFDSACQLWKTSCGERLSCLVYDSSKYRYYMHGVTIGFESVAVLLSIVLNIVIRRRSGKYDTNPEDPKSPADHIDISKPIPEDEKEKPIEKDKNQNI